MASLEEEDSNDCPNAMEVDKESDKSSASGGEDSSSVSSDAEEEVDNKVANLEQKVSQNPYDYSANVDLINALRKMGELERLREAREKMNKNFPLSAELWKDWLEDETKVATTPEERTAVKALFERAVKDYMSVALWLEFVQFNIGLMDEQDGTESVRSVFERALTAAGLHVAKGAMLWEAYREFEQCMLTMLEGQAEASAEAKDKYEAQKRRLAMLFRRQLSVPLMDMERTYEEYHTWAGDTADPNVEPAYKKALAKLSKVLPFEMQLMSTPDSRAEVYRAYLAHERGEGEPARIQCLYERALAELCLDPALWLEYLQYLEQQLKMEAVVLPVCERAVRNCPWSAPLWVGYLRALERYSSTHSTVTAVLEQALAVGFSSAPEYRALWLAYLDYLRRRVQWGEAGEADQLKELRAAYNRACEHLAQTFGLQGDPSCTVLQAWARMEAAHVRDMEASRRLWSDILSQGHDRSASMWLEYIGLEKCYGDTKHLRRLYQRALTATQDWPESVGEAWLNFERDEGTLETFEACEAKYEVRVKAVQQLRQQQEAAAAQTAQTGAAAEGAGRHGRRDALGKRKEEGSRWAALGGRSVTLKGPALGNGQTAGGEPSGSEPPAKKAKWEPGGGGRGPEHGMTVPHDPSKDSRTVFVSNLEYSVTEEAVREQFAPLGTITDLRLVKDYKGRSKGYCYVEFSSQAEAGTALKKDREALGGRPMFVSKCDPDRQRRQPGFKYSSDLEKNKLFIRGLPLTTTKEDLEELFKPFGKLKDVRIVTYRNGHSKGLAYVEFHDEAAAAHALIKTDGTTIGERTISVAISKPPVRKAETAPPSAPVALGGGLKERGARGRGRTQVFVPRALQRPGGAAPTAPPAAAAKAKSNSDFRQMLLGSK